MKRFLCTFGLGLLAFATGCPHMMVPERARLGISSRYGQLAQLMEGEIRDPSAAPTSQLWYLCYSYSKLKRYDKLFPCLDQLQANIETGDRLFYSFDLSPFPFILRAEAHIEFGNYAQAVAEARKAYAVVEQQDPLRSLKVSALSVFTLSLALHGNREAAGKYAQLLAAIDTRYRTGPLETEKLIGLAKVYVALGEFQKSLDVIRRYAGDSTFAHYELPVRFILNKGLFETGHTAEAKVGYDALLATPETREHGDIFWVILFDRGRIAEREGKLEEAIEFYRRAIDVIEQQRSTINTEASKIGYVGDKQQVYRRMVGALFVSRRYDKAFEYVEGSKSRALVDLLASKKDFALPRGRETQVAGLVTALDAAEEEARIQEVPPQPTGGDRRRFGEVQIKEQLRSAAPELASLVTVAPVSAPEIRSLLAPDETLVEYYYMDDDLYAFVATRDVLTAAKLEGAGLVQAVREYRAALQDPKSRRHQELGRRLYRRLVEPLAQAVKTRNVVIVPHGVLHYLPFSTLPAGDDSLVDVYSIRLLPSASVLQFLKDREARKASRLLAIGNPDLGDPAYDLRYAQAEVMAIGKDFQEVKILVRLEATKAAFKSLAGGFNYVHLATHGKFDPDAPLHSGLLLAGSTQSDGFLPLDELYSLRLDADLVTLSACETGLGKVHQGDDVVGLVRGFLYAGSNVVVASLWKVEDRATAYLMTEFYANLRNDTKREALRRAQLATKRHFEHPFFWGAFYLTGTAD